MTSETVTYHRANMPTGAQRVLDRRTLGHGNEGLIASLQNGMSVLDVGCGSGSITQGVVNYVGGNGKVVGIDMSEDLIQQAKTKYPVPNLSFHVADIFKFESKEKFDVITSARTLQWMSEPSKAIARMVSLLKPGGRLSILDYNHEKIEWTPLPPASMQNFYSKFLTWRSDAGMNNGIGDDLARLFAAHGLTNVDVSDQSERSSQQDADFVESAGIWTKVAETRGKQLVSDGYITDAERLLAIDEYQTWLTSSAQSMKLYLLCVTGVAPSPIPNN